MWRTGTFLLLMLINQQVFAQDIISNQQVFKVGDGLPQSFITGILQDKNGFLWISTSDGLARYDGRSFKTFSKQKSDPKGLHSSVISLLLPNGPNNFMIVYDGGMVADFNPLNYKIKNTKVNIPLQVHGVLISPLAENKIKTDNINLFYTNGYGKGINAYNLSTDKTKFYGVANDVLKNDTIIGITQNDSGTFYLMTAQGLEVSKDGLNSFEFIPHKIPDEIKNNYFKDIIQMPDKSFAIISDNKLFLINPFNKENIEIQIPGSKSKVVRFEKLMGIDNNGKLYFEYNGSVFRLEKNNVVKLLWTNSINPNLRITACFIDKTDVLWISVDAQGLIKKNLQTAPFYSYNYKNDFFTDVYDKAGISKNVLPSKWFEDKITSYLYYNFYTHDSLLYLIHSTQKSGNDNAYFYKKGILKSLPEIPKNKFPMLRGLTISEDGNIWSADIQNSGLWNWKNNVTTPVFYPFDTTTNNSINGTEIGDIELVNNQIWISTYGKGLYLFENGKLNYAFNKKYTSSNLPNNLTDIIQDPNDADLLWIGSRGEGLLLLNKKNGFVKIFNTDNGLPNNTIYCIVSDESGFLWLSTNNGICRFNPKDFSSTSYVKADGLAGAEFNRNHKMIFPDGRIAFGGLDGYSIFNPNDFKDKRKSSLVQLQITRLFINNEEEDFTGSLNLFNNNSGEATNLKLPYNKNNLSIEFAALQFNEPQKIRYRYMLKGLDESWRESGFSNTANFAQLIPGNYNLLINATSTNGEWSSSIRELNIIISPPFWKTWWAYIFYFLMISFLLRSYIRFNKSKLKKDHEAILIQKEADGLKEMAEMKDKFFSNITHEFRTPLTLILSPLEKLQSDNSLSTNANLTVQTIYRNTRRLLILINEFLDFSKLKNGIVKVNLSTGNMVLFVSDIVQEFKENADGKNIELIFGHDVESSGLYYFDKDKFEKIITNLLSNALKFTPSGGIINVYVSRIENSFKIKVCDTGKGISETDKQRVFERFYQVEPNTILNSPGTGIGLALVKELTGLMNGKVEVISEIEKGSTFIISIPVDKADVLKTKVPASNTLFSVKTNNNENTLQEKQTILIAEDDEELRLFIANSFSNDFNVIVAADGNDAWEKIISEMPDVIISDVMMPHINGIDLCKLCKDDIRTSHISFILLTTRTTHELKMQGLHVGADDYITKPFHLDELLVRINNMLRLQQKQKEFLQSQVINKKPVGELPKVDNDFLTEFYKIVEENIDDSQMGVDFISNALSMSKSSLNRKLKSILNISTNDLIKNYRLQKATLLLKDGFDITSTAYKVGFTSPSYFTKCFKEEFEITPSEFVERL